MAADVTTYRSEEFRDYSVECDECENIGKVAPHNCGECERDHAGDDIGDIVTEHLRKNPSHILTIWKPI